MEMGLLWENLPLYLKKPEKDFLANDARLWESYARCRAAGITTNINKPKHKLPDNELGAFFARYRYLAYYSDLLFSDILQYLPDQRVAFILTGPDAHIIEVFARSEVVKLVSKQCGLHPGVSVLEESIGTNAIALALHHQETMIVQGEQHFCDLFKDWTCIAAPIRDVAGEIIAYVNISIPQQSPVSEKLALMKYMAMMLEAFYKIGSPFNGETHIAHRPRIRLTERQQQVLSFFAKGLSYKEIAKELNLSSTKTVEEHLNAVCKKFSTKSRRECILIASKCNFL